jgi:heme exporter protein C
MTSQSSPSEVSKGLGTDLLFLGLTAVLLVAGITMSFYYAPLLKHQGADWWSQKIFYIHLPSAWGALGGLLLVLTGSVAYLSRRSLKWDTFAVAASEICFVFASNVLITGPLWARPSWGTAWDWQDPRLMSFLALWLLLGAYFLLRTFGLQGAQVRVASATLGIIGALSVPFVYAAVKFSALHPPPSKMRVGLDVRLTVWVCNFAFFFFFLFLMRFRRRLEDQNNRLHRLKMKVQEIEDRNASYI